MVAISIDAFAWFTQYLATHSKISQNNNTRGPQHVVEEDFGMGGVVGASTWMLSSWFGPLNEWFSPMEELDRAVVKLILEK